MPKRIVYSILLVDVSVYSFIAPILAATSDLLRTKEPTMDIQPSLSFMLICLLLDEYENSVIPSWIPDRSAQHRY